jgi:hypothetical protein
VGAYGLAGVPEAFPAGGGGAGLSSSARGRPQTIGAGSYDLSVTQEELDKRLFEMRANNVGIIDAIKFVRTEQGIELGEAKEFVSRHLAYRDVHDAAAPLHDELSGYAEALDEGAEPEERGA